MNTTSMEFVISQERTKKSPLVLSEFMGISSNMDDAMQINPWNLSVSGPSFLSFFDCIAHDAGLQEVAAAMHRGLTMPEDEKARRHEQLYKTVTTHTSHTWATMLAKKLLERLGSSNMARRTPFIPKYELERHYATARKRLFLFPGKSSLC